MDAQIGDARRWGWAFRVAAVSPEGEVFLLDPARASNRGEVRIGGEAQIDNLLTWLE